MASRGKKRISLRNLLPNTSKTSRTHHLRSFGRVRGRVLKPARKQRMDDLLPKLALPEGKIFPAEIFAGKSFFELEIGFGSGERLLAMTERQPDRGFIGCEVYVNGISNFLKEIEDKKLNNLRLFTQDVRLLLERIEPETLDQVTILFPDPWPKTRHHKRRLIQQEMLAAITRVLKPGGRLFLASDHADYTGWIIAHLTNCKTIKILFETAQDWRLPPADYVTTRYAEKSMPYGAQITYIHAQKLLCRAP